MSFVQKGQIHRDRNSIYGDQRLGEREMGMIVNRYQFLLGVIKNVLKLIARWTHNSVNTLKFTELYTLIK